MKEILLALLLAVLLRPAEPVFAGSFAGDEEKGPPSSIKVVIGDSEVIKFDGLKRVIVGDGSIISVKSLGSDTVLVAAKKAGTTTLLLWGRTASPSRVVVNVTEEGAEALQRDLRGALGQGSQIRVDRVGDRLVVSGAPESPEEARQVAALVDKNPRVVNLVRSSAQDQMVAMEVRFLEVKKNALESLGVNWQKSMSGPIFGVVGDLKTNNQFRPASDGVLLNGSPSVTSNFPGVEGSTSVGKVSPFHLYFGLQSTLLSVINFLEQSGDAVVLAEPILTCKSGGSARFLAGGEVPLPTTSALGTSSVQFKPYGIRFEVNPTIQAGGSISATITTELSTIDPAVKVGELPGFLSRMTQTEVTLREGETLILSGLISEEASKSLQKVSGLGDVPLLSRLFRSTDFQEKRSEMVVFVTPRRIGAQSERNIRSIEDASRLLDRSRASIYGRTTEPNQGSDFSDRSND